MAAPEAPDYQGRAFYDKAERVAEEISREFHRGCDYLKETGGSDDDVDEVPEYHELIAVAANVLRKAYPNG
jgi:hypothetical protein